MFFTLDRFLLSLYTINKIRRRAVSHLNRRRKEMTKAELAAKIAAVAGITKSQGEKAVDGFVSAVSGALAGGDKLTLVGFGTFSVGARSQREGRNPRTGEKIIIPASKAVKFKAGKTLSEKIK
jgi:DNA-binding protein HU-beta